MIMKELVVAANVSTEARLRSTATEKIKSQKLRDFRFERYRFLFTEKNSSCKFETLKLTLLVIICCTLLSLAFSPVIHKEQQPSSDSSSRSRFVVMERIWQETGSDPRYLSHVEVDWVQLSNLVNNTNPRIGLLNFNSSEVGFWRRTLPETVVSPIELEYAPTSVTWEILYPEWIDEEEEYHVPSCPSLPRPIPEEGSKFDLVAVKLPCNRSGGGWSRDVARLHLQLAAARVAADAAAARVRVLIVSDCFPIPNLFRCRDLVKREGNLWLYEPKPAALEEKLRLPVGSCELVVPFEAKEISHTEFGSRREAYVTILHSAEQYVCGAIAAAKSIRLAGSKRDLVVLVDKTIGEEYRRGLADAGWKVRMIRRIRNPKAKRDAYNEWNYSKFRLWQLSDYDKVVFIDADLLVLRNADFLFSLTELSAVGNDGTLFNSGVMVVEPSECMFRLLMDHVDEITSYNGGDQGYLNEIFTWWHRLPKSVNYLKHFGGDEQRRAKNERLFAADPPAIYLAHYLGLKPWRCFRDYDCNWNLKSFWKFGSDAAHGKWWRVHDAMPESLQQFCLLSTKGKAFLEYNRRRAEAEGFADGHWRRNVTDPRSEVCSEAFCDWESMLVHWGENTSSTAGGRVDRGNRTARLQI
ncbi:UDP-glucuronate:xylan alpha-glucuronosyltransferase 1-like isoform X1 [Zingiber officinale]|uniref:UDP-glucuronate:xylan alpha-glucuronosyltransferase 1-like isoform X1 n=1 Tax=Zingiber officinale TaxID=94328 RepID=UPI001C4B012A|nr:UDP-glucuronate:xylan alpha-glucuronosyltransferase 1-like isoform X1 [Zingiber officinale]XP_042419546.1 UDP-glucuronate:xylan alpha-glucuronosyltransferase 1-like isoform X1 [Zingiber officinale]